MRKDDELRSRLEEIFSTKDQSDSLLEPESTSGMTDQGGKQAGASIHFEQMPDLADILQKLVIENNKQGLLQKTVSEIKERLNYLHVQIYDFPPLRWAAGYGLVGKKLGEAIQTGKTPSSFAVLSAAQGKSSLIEEKHPEWQPNPYLPQAIAEIGVPVKLGGDTLAILDVFLDVAGETALQTQAQLEILCAHLAIVIYQQNRADQLSTANDRLQEMASLSTDWQWEVDQQNFFCHSSDRIIEVLGYSPDDIIGKSFAEVMPSDEGKRFLSILEKAAASNRPLRSLVLRLKASDGQDKLFLTNASPTNDSSGNVIGYRGVSQDVTDRRRSESVMGKRVRELHCLSDIGHRVDEKPALPEFLHWLCDRIPEAMQYPEICRVAVTLGENTYGHAEAVDLATKMVGGIRIKNELLGYLHIAYTKPNSFSNEESAFIGGVVGRISSYIETLRLLEQAKEALQQAQEARERYETVIEGSNDGTWDWNIARNQIYFSPRWKALIGYEDHEFPNEFSEFENRIHPEDHDSVMSNMSDYLAGKSTLYNPEFRLQHKDGSYRWILARGIVKRDENGNPQRMAGSHMDITERKTSEDALKFSQLQLNQAMATAGMAYWEIDLGNAVIQANDRLYKLLGVTLEDVGSYSLLVEDFLSRFVHPQDQENVRLQLRQIIETNGAEKNGRMEFRLKRPGGDYWHAIADYQTAYNETGQVNKIFGAFLNVTDIKTAQLTLEQRATELATVAEVSLAASSMKSMNELLEEVVSLTQSRFNLYHTHIFLLNEQNHMLQMYACGWDEPNAHGTHEPGEIPLYQEQSLVARAARTGDVVVVNDVSQDPMWLPNSMLPDTASELAIPLMAGNRLLGVLDVQARELNRFSKDSITVQKTLAAQIAIAIQNTYQYQQTQIALKNAEDLYAASEKIVQALAPQEVLNELVTFPPLKQFSRANILIFNKPWVNAPPDYYQVKAVWERSGQPSPIPVGTIYTREQIPLVELFSVEQPSPIFILDIESDRRVSPAFREAMLRIGMRSIALFPMVAGNQLIGGVTVQSPEMVNLSEEELRAIHSLIDEAAAVTQSWQLRQNLEERLQELTALQQNLSRESWSSYQATRTGEILGYEYDLVKVQPSNTVLNTTQTLAHPLQVRGLIVGQVGIQHQGLLEIPEEDMALLESMADQVSQALERARLLEQTQKSATELKAVAEVSTAASSILDPIELLQTVVDLTEKRFGLYHVGVYLLENDLLNLVAGSGSVGREMQRNEWHLTGKEASIITRAASSRKGHILNDIKDAIGYTTNPLLPDTAAELAIPMIVGQQLLGILDAQSVHVNRFSEDDLQTFTTLATQTAIALQNARLFAEQTVTVEKLREVDHLKSAFLANMSHELRTPLNSILGFTQVIMEGLDGPLTDYMTNDLQLIEKNGQHLLNLINEVLDMAKIDSGRMNLVIEDVDLRMLVDEVSSTISAQATNKNLYLVNEMDSAANWVIKGDEIRLRQVLLNLLSNAIKFTNDGGITVQAENKESKILLTVKDTGLGIPTDKLDMIFEAFTQVDTTTTRKVGGTGLGLPISRKLINLHGGKLWAESSGIEGEGSVFKIELPLQFKQTSS